MGVLGDALLVVCLVLLGLGTLRGPRYMKIGVWLKIGATLFSCFALQPSLTGPLKVQRETLNNNRSHIFPRQGSKGTP